MSLAILNPNKYYKYATQSKLTVLESFSSITKVSSLSVAAFEYVKYTMSWYWTCRSAFVAEETILSC